MQAATWTVINKDQEMSNEFVRGILRFELLLSEQSTLLQQITKKNNTHFSEIA